MAIRPQRRAGASAEDAGAAGAAAAAGTETAGAEAAGAEAGGTEAAAAAAGASAPIDPRIPFAAAAPAPRVDRGPMRLPADGVGLGAKLPSRGVRSGFLRPGVAPVGSESGRPAQPVPRGR